MIKDLFQSHIAFVGGGQFCKTLLELLYSDIFADRRPSIIGVSDINEQAVGLQYAKKLGIFTTNDYRELYRLENLQVLIELTWDIDLGNELNETKPAGVKFFNHIESRALWDFLQLEREKRKALGELQQHPKVDGEIISLFELFANRLEKVVTQRNFRYIEIEKELVTSERATAQIIEGSTIPTFVINKDHITTHWNKACENLTGYAAASICGTNKQWTPFRETERPTMADLILDGVGEKEVWKYYGTRWRKSALIEGAYEAEEYFPHLGKNGKWIWFTAAPIKAPDGTTVGAIETLWDKTEDKKAEEEKERYTRELATLCSIYAALNVPLELEDRLDAANEAISNFLSAEAICIYLLEPDGNFRLKYTYGSPENTCEKMVMADKNSIIQRVAQKGELTIFENIADGGNGEIRILAKEGLKSMAYIPISTKENKVFGVIRIGTKTSKYFAPEEKNVLELIGNRVGAAIENSMLQQELKRSEEKYRSLFENDPNPTFILDSNSFSILDTNQRAQDSYGYTRDELLGISFLQLGEDSDEELTQGLKNLSPGQSVLFTKKRHFRKGEKPFYVNINMSSAKYGDRDVIIASSTDITEVVEKETQLIQAGKMTTLGVMAAGMAHEINQPLNVIQVCADFFLKMLNRGQPISDEDLRTMANDIVANVGRAAGVIKHVRDFARQSELVRTKVNINDPIKDVFKVLGHQLKVHDIETTLDLDPELPAIMAEHNRLEQVFINLVSNAIDAMDEKTARPGFQDAPKQLCIKSFAENGRVVALVSDTGIGMSEEVKNKIIEPFFTTKKVGKGTGLGVSISYGIVKDYDGSLEIESQIDVGTTFKLLFPAARQDMMTDE